jgi:hypothetical protein
MKTMISAKKEVFTRLGFLFVSIMILSLCTTCNKDINNISVNYESFTTTYDFVFLDAKSGNLIGETSNLSVSVEFKGPDAGLIRDISGANSTNYKSDKGFLSIGIKTDAKLPSAANPLQFVMVANVNGYITTSLPVTIYDTIQGSMEILLVNLSDPPPGISIVESNSLVINNGTVSSTVNLSTPLVNNLTTKATLIIPQGAVLKDKAGALLSGTANIRLLYGDGSNTSDGVFPGGGLTTKVSIDNVTSDGMFFSAGFIDLEITDQSGKKAAFIENNPLNVQLEIPANAYNPETETSVIAGDIIPIWSYNMDEGQWIFEFNDTTKVVNERLIIESQLSHLTPWNVDKRIPMCINVNGYPIISFKSSTLTSNNSVTFEIDVFRQSDGAWLDRFGTFTVNKFDGSVKLPLWYGYTIPVALSAVERYSNEFLGGQLINNTCAPGNYDLFLTKGTGPALENSTLMHVSVSGKCGSVTVKPSFGFYYRRALPTRSAMMHGCMRKGEAVVSVFPNSTYEGWAYFNGKTSYYQVQILQPDHSYYQAIDVILPAEFCK